MGGYTQQIRNPDSWEGWYWGAKHVWGCEPIGTYCYFRSNIYYDVAKNTELLICQGSDPETTPWGFGRRLYAGFIRYWFTELGIKQIFICPDLNYAAAVHADKWIPILPNTDAALQLAIAYQWIIEGTYDKEYVKTHSVGFDKFADYVTGKEDGVPKTPKWAAEKTRCPCQNHQSPGERMGCQKNYGRPMVLAGLISGDHIPASLPAWKSACWGCRELGNRASISSV